MNALTRPTLKNGNSSLIIFLSRRKILKYTETDLIGNLKENLKELKTNNLNNESTKKQVEKLEKQIEDAEACDALASTILITNISKEILEYIKNLKSAFEIMQKLKSLYGNKKICRLFNTG